ncbi:MAG: hypothetical protein ACK50Q_15505 [Labrys sp. (in: a-proteobacteria)]
MAHDHRHHAEPAPVGGSLLRASAWHRLGMAAVLITAIWLGVFWAWS